MNLVLLNNYSSGFGSCHHHIHNLPYFRGLDIHLMQQQNLQGGSNTDVGQKSQTAGQSAVKIEVNDKEVVAHLGEYTYDIGNFGDADDLLNCSPKAKKNFKFEIDISDGIPKTVQDVDDSSSTTEEHSTSVSFTENPTIRTRRCGSRRLWEFIRDLLNNCLYNPSHIKWVNQHKGEFKIIKTANIAQMWGKIKNNDGMTYEKMSRAMRYYYKRQILAPVLNRRLVYKFGPKSYGW